MTIAKKTLFTTKTDFSSYKVVDRVYNYRPARVLYGIGKSPQSGIALDDEPELLFHYNQRFLEIVISMHPSSVLIIGGGAFTLPTYLFNRFEDMKIDVIEIDPGLTPIAHDYFDLPYDNRLMVINGDGRDYAEQSEKTYDLIILDAFSGYDIPKNLLSLEAIRSYKKILNPNGLIAVNFISTYFTYKKSLAHEVMATFESVMDQVELYPADHENDKRMDQNLILTASNKPIALDYLQSSSVQLLFQPENAILID